MYKHNIKIITHDLAIGGLQRVVVNICKTINRDLFNISVLCMNELGDFTSEIERMGINVDLLPQKEQGVDYLAFLNVSKILKKDKIEIIHTHNTQPFIDGTLGALLAGVKTIVHTDHARDFPDKKRYMIAEWVMSHFAYKVVGVSAHTVNNLIKYEKILESKTITILNGIDETNYDVNIDRDQMRKQIGIQGNGPIIGLGVRLSKQKGIEYLLQAMSTLINEIPNISLVIAGNGPLEEELKKQARDLGIANNVYFLGPRLDINRLLKLFDLYVLPSLWEGLPMVLLEAMAAGCPIIATNVGGNSMAIQHGYNGSLIEPKSTEMLISEIKKLLANPCLMSEYSKNSYQLIHDKFSARIMTSKYEKLYLREL